MLKLADYFATRMAPGGGLPTIANGKLAFASGSKPAGPQTPLGIRLVGTSVHGGDAHVYPVATVAVADPVDAFYDVTDYLGDGGWRSQADPVNDCGSMNVVWRHFPRDLAHSFGSVAFAFATLWGTPGLQYFNGLQCPARPKGYGARYPVFATGIPEGAWTTLPIWWPNNAETAAPSCAVDPAGSRTALGALWRGDVMWPLTTPGGVGTVEIPVMIGESYWFGAPDPPYNLEKLYFAEGLGCIGYDFWQDNSIEGTQVAIGAAPDLLDTNGANVSQPSLPTGTSGEWALVIRVAFNQIVAASSLGLPADLTAQQFFAGIAGFPGQGPAAAVAAR